jgi:hypothetical protein
MAGNWTSSVLYANANWSDKQVTTTPGFILIGYRWSSVLRQSGFPYFTFTFPLRLLCGLSMFWNTFQCSQHLRMANLGRNMYGFKDFKDFKSDKCWEHWKVFQNIDKPHKRRRGKVKLNSNVRQDANVQYYGFPYVQHRPCRKWFCYIVNRCSALRWTLRILHLKSFVIFSPRRTLYKGIAHE